MLLLLALMAHVILTSAPQGGGTDIQSPLAAHVPAANVTLVSYVSGTGHPSVARYHHGSGAVDTVALTDDANLDDHDRPAVLVLSDGSVLAAWSNHNDDGFAARSTDAGATWTEPVTLSGEYTYPQLYELDDGVHLLYRDGHSTGGDIVALLSDDGGASWGTPSTILDGEYVTVHSDGERVDLFRRESSVNGPDWDLHHAYYDGQWRRSDGTPISVPFDAGDMTVVYADGTLKAAGLTAGPGMLCYMTYQSGDPYPAVLGRTYHLATWDGDTWEHEEVASAGDGPLHFVGCAIESATSVYLIRPVDGVHQVWHYRKDGGEWTGAQLTFGATDQLRTIVPRGARPDLPVVWDHGTWADIDDWDMGLAGLARGVVSSLSGSQSAWPSMRP